MPETAATPSVRERQIARFLAAAGWGTARRATLAGDASFRRYERLTDGPRRCVLMDAPPPSEAIRPFVTLARHLRDLGFAAPDIYAEDTAAGLMLLEDFGDDSFARRLAAGTAPEPLYTLAVDVLVALHKLPPERAVPAGLPPYDSAALLAEALLFADWFLPAARGGRPLAENAKESFRAAWLAVFDALSREPPTLVLRDFFPDNLMWRADAGGLDVCGLLDFQDALAGPRAYDLVSLLEDARRDVAPALRATMTKRYLAAFPDVDHAAFTTDCTILAAQRHAKVIGIFTRLSRRDGKDGYLRHIPRVWRLFEAALTHPALAPVARWIETHVPPEERRLPR